MSCIAYLACKMTGRDKHEQVARAKYLCAILRQYGITPISPVLEENVKDQPGILVNDDRDKLYMFWRRDKEIIRRQAHVVILDGADAKSYGMEREYALNRFCLWKPTILLMPEHSLNVADLEDDYIAADPHIVGEFIRARFMTQWQRVTWRLRMLARSLPRWIVDQLYAFR